MLDKLPREVVLTISDFLTLQEKLNLITTCRHLFKLISNATLFSNLYLFARQTTAAYSKNVEAFLEGFKKSGYSGSQVKVLSINMLRTDLRLQVQLPILFPNIARISTHEHLGLSQLNNGPIDQSLLLPWTKTLEIYSSVLDWSALLPLLKTTTFPRLRILELKYDYYVQDKAEGFDIPYFLPYIKNAPSLRILTLRKCAVNLEFLEEVHASCPHLESLILDQTPIVIRNQVLNQAVVPAESLLTLKIEQAHYFDPNGMFLDYIARKYRCLKQLKLSFNNDYKSEDFWNNYRKVVVKARHVDTWREESDPKIREYVHLYESLKTEFENTLTVYKTCGQKFFSNLTKSAKSFEIHTNAFDDIMQALANSNTDSFKLVISGWIEDVKQLEYVKNVRGLWSLELHAFIIQQNYNYNFTCTNITRLILHGWVGVASASSLGSSYGKVNELTPINCILEAFPSLEELRAFGSFKLTATDNNMGKRFPRLKKLSLQWNSTDEPIMDYLKQVAPNIQDMTIKIPPVKDFTMDISGWELKQLVVAPCTFMVDTQFYCYITTPNTKSLTKYDPKEKSLAVVKSRSYSDGNHKLSVVNIITTKEKQFKFNGFLISLSHDKITIDV